MPTFNRDLPSGTASGPEDKPKEPDINLQDLAERVLNLMKKEARIEQERLGKKPQRKTRR